MVQEQQHDPDRSDLLVTTDGRKNDAYLIVGEGCVEIVGAFLRRSVEDHPPQLATGVPVDLPPLVGHGDERPKDEDRAAPADVTHQSNQIDRDLGLPSV